MGYQEIRVFTDSIEQNKETIEELIRSLPAGQQHRAKSAATSIEKMWHGLRKDNPKDPAFALGAAWSIYQIAAKLVEDAKESSPENTSLIQLLS